MMDEWSDWECPVCGSVQSDPESMTITTCANKHLCLLGPSEEDGNRHVEHVEYGTLTAQ